MADQIDWLKLSAARLWASGKFPYFASGLFALTLVSSTGIGTLAVDSRWRLYVDPEVVDAWSVPELGAVLVHELSHLLRDHASRAEQLGVGDSRAVAWNIACDAEINDDLLAAQLPLPGAPVTPGGCGWPDSELAESYFARILAAESGTKGTGVDGYGIVPVECGSGSHSRQRLWDDQGEDRPGVDHTEADLLRRLTAQSLSTYARTQPGDVPAGWLRWAEDQLDPVVDWRRVLAAEIRKGLVRAAGCCDYTFARRSRRASASTGVVLPGTYRPTPQVAVVLDTSGSMDGNLLLAALAEVDGILGRIGLPVRRIPVLSCDAEVGAISLVRNSADVEIVGGGGTDMGAGIEAAARLRPRPQVIVVLTDGFTPWPLTPPPSVSVVVGLLQPDASDHVPDVPGWARCVAIEEAA